LIYLENKSQSVTKFLAARYAHCLNIFNADHLVKSEAVLALHTIYITLQYWSQKQTRKCRAQMYQNEGGWHVTKRFL